MLIYITLQVHLAAPALKSNRHLVISARKWIVKKFWKNNSRFSTSEGEDGRTERGAVIKRLIVNNTNQTFGFLEKSLKQTYFFLFRRSMASQEDIRRNNSVGKCSFFNEFLKGPKRLTLPRGNNTRTVFNKRLEKHRYYQYTCSLKALQMHLELKIFLIWAML